MQDFAQKQDLLQPQTSLHVAEAGGKTRAASHPPHLMHLQRTIGNQAVLRLMRANAIGSHSHAGGATRFGPDLGHDFGLAPAHPRSPGIVQPKLTVNSPGDVYEQEADSVSEQVMRAPEPQLQRACACGGTCDDCQKKQSGQQPAPLQMKRGDAGGPGPTEAPPSVHEALQSPGQPLDSATRAFMEPRFGQDFGQVRVHTDDAADASAQEVNSRAYTVGSDIVFAGNEFSPPTSDGRKLLAHELTHVLQQSNGATSIQRAPNKDNNDDDDEYKPVVKGPRPFSLLSDDSRMCAPGKCMADEDVAYLGDVIRQEAQEKLDEKARQQKMEQEFMERGKKVAPQDAEIIPRDEMRHIRISRTCSDVYPEICAGNGSGDYLIIGIEGTNNVIFRKLSWFYRMGIDAFHRNIGRMGMVASGAWEGSKGVLYAGAAVAQKAGQIGRMLPFGGGVGQLLFRGLEKAGSEGLKELDRMEAERLGYPAYEQTPEEQAEENLNYLDPTGLTPEITPESISSEHSPAGHEAPSGAPHEASGSLEAPSRTEPVHSEPTAKTARETAKESAVSEIAQREGSKIELGNGTHDIAAYGKGEEAGFTFCSTKCPLLRQKLDNIIEVLPKDYDPVMVRNLKQLANEVRGIDAPFRKGDISEEVANTRARPFAQELEKYAHSDSNLDQLLQMSPEYVKANRTQLQEGLKKAMGRGREIAGQFGEPAKGVEEELEESGGYQHAFEGPLGDIVSDPKEAGALFNKVKVPEGAHSEVTLRTPGGRHPRVDLWVKGYAIISRKFPMGQLANDELKALDYVQELRVKYPQGAPIVAAGLKGEVLTGIQVLQVPVQYIEIPDRVLSYASAHNIVIVDIDGKVYNP